MLSLDTDKMYYRPGPGDKPPVAYSLGEIVSMIEQSGTWHADEELMQQVDDGKKADDGNGGASNKNDEPIKPEEITANDNEIQHEEFYYSRELGCKLSYAEMIEGIDPEMLPQEEDDLELLLFCYDAVSLVA